MSPSASIPAFESQPAPLAGSLALTSKEFKIISELARREFGLELGDGKQQLVAARLGKVMRRHGFDSFRAYFQHVQNDSSGHAREQLIDALTTNHTSFFREQAHFDFLLHHVFPLCRQPDGLRIWSAASATGEEPYTIALLAREFFANSGSRLPPILASDISTQALTAARKGMFRADRFDGILAPWIRRHLLRGEGRWQGWYRMRPEILAMVEFRRINLIEPLPDIGRFAVIFCRNVMIYFSRPTQEQLIARLVSCLQPGGYLFVGHSESLTGFQHGLQPIQPAIYRKRESNR